MKFQVPNLKLQISSKIQQPIINDQGDRYWSLDIEIYLGLGACDLEFQPRIIS